MITKSQMVGSLALVASAAFQSSLDQAFFQVGDSRIEINRQIIDWLCGAGRFSAGRVSVNTVATGCGLIGVERSLGSRQGEVTGELQRLKERVAVLERLFTDDDRKLANEIERLRRMDTNLPA